MVMQILFAFGLTSVTVMIHGLGTLQVIAHLSRVWRHRKGNRGFSASVMHIVGVVSVLLVLHWLEAAVWAAFFLASGALPDFETATYFSLTSYATLGYGDVVLP